MIGDSGADVQAGQNAGCRESFLLDLAEGNGLINIILRIFAG